MSTTRAVTLAAVASAGILAAGWHVGTADGRTLAASSHTSSQLVPASAGSATAPTTATDTAPAASGTTDTTTDGTGGGVSGTFTGATASHRFGSVTVTVTLSDGRITALSEEVVSDGDGHSERINAGAVPMVRASVLAADSADVATIGGATYTTGAYLTSLQSALDQAP